MSDSYKETLIIKKIALIRGTGGVTTPSEGRDTRIHTYFLSYINI